MPPAPQRKIHTEAELRRHIQKQAVEVPNTRRPGQTGHFRSVLSPNELVKDYPDIRTVYEGFEAGMRRAGANAPCLGARRKVAGPTNWTGYEWQSFGQVSARRLNFGSGLVKLYVDVVKRPATDKWHLGLYSVNRPEWLMADWACCAYSLVTVALFDTLGADAIEYILNHSEAPMIATSLDKVSAVLRVSQRCPGLKVIISMDDLTSPQGDILKQWATEKGLLLISFTDVEALGKKHPLPPRPPKPEDVFTLCYTSGTTGKPKGAILTHSAFVASGRALECQGLEFTPQDIHFSYLPLAHSYDRMNCCGMVTNGVPIGFSRGDVTLLMEDVAMLKPTIFCSVPRLWNRIYARILQMTVHSGSALKAGLFQRAFDGKSASVKSSGVLTHALWDRLVFNKVKAVLGGRVRVMISGSAPISPEVLNFLRVVFSCHVLEGWGQTETAAVCTVTWLPDLKSGGKVGPPIPSTEIKLVDIPEMSYLSTDKPYPRGELCVRGPNMFKGYYKDEKNTRETIDEEGWVHTGDVGLIDERGLIQIIDRKKHIFKLSQGEYVAPEKLENIFITCPFVAQVFVHGDSLRNDLVAIVVLEPEHTIKTAISKGWIPAGVVPPAFGQVNEHTLALAKNPKLKQLIMEEFRGLAKKKKLAGFEIPKAIHVEANPMSIENGLLTPTVKVKRDVAAKHFRSVIDAMYVDISKGITVASEASKL